MAGRPRAEDKTIRVVHLLDLLLKGGDTTVEVLAQELKERGCKQVGRQSVRRDVELLAKAGWPVSLGEMRLNDGSSCPAVLFDGPTYAFQWEGTAVGRCLSTDTHTRSLFARAMVDDLQEMEEVRWVILGSGVMVQAVASEIFLRDERTALKGVSTTNVLVQHEYIHHKPRGITLEMASGTFDLQTASLLTQSGTKYEQGRYAEAIVTGFSGLTHDGFHTNSLHDVWEKQRDLDPQESMCRYIMIPLAWEKIGNHHTAVRFPEDIGRRKYILYTDGPKCMDRDRIEIISHWKNKFPDHFTVRYVG